MSASLAEIKALLQANAEALAQTLAPDGHRSGKWWVAHNPTRDDKNESFGIAISGGAPGAWKDFATDDKGDILGLIGYVLRLDDMRAILEWACGWLGIDGAPPVAVAKRVQQATADAAARSLQAEHEAAEKAKSARGIYLNSRKQQFLGSPADMYLRQRGIDVGRLPRIPGCLGWLAEQYHGESKCKWPVMVAGFCDGHHIVAVHRTFLNVGGIGKAPVKPARKIWPSYKGAAIYLSRGGTDLPVKAAIGSGVRETLVLTEGVEDGLSVALACPDKRVWAAGSLNNLAEITLPECIDEVIVCADNDWGKPQAMKALNTALAALARQGVEVRVARSSVGKDVNDALVM